MLILKVIFLMIFSHFTFAKEINLNFFEKDVVASDIEAKCDYQKGDETGIFSIEYKENYISHHFLILRGIDPVTCKWHEREVKKILRSSKMVTLSGRNGSENPARTEKIISWMWVSVKNHKTCHSYFINDCP